MRGFTMDRAAPEALLSISIQNTKPVELGDLTKSLSALADEFQRHLIENDPEASAADVRLYVREIKTGSIVADVIAISPQLLQGISYLNAVIGFAKHSKAAYDYLTGKSNDKPELDKTSYENFANIVEPIAKDHGAQLNVNAPQGNVVINLNSTEANAAQNSARKEIEKLQSSTSRLHEKVLLYWYQARAEPTSKAGDKGIIESISPNPVKVICATDQIKLQMIFDLENPFKEAYVVDVIVETIKGKPALYKIIAVHEKFQRDDL